MNSILLCEDEREIQELVAEYLNENGFKVYCVSNGIEAIDRFKELEKELDCILLDVMMPSLNGFEVLRFIRQRSNVPVIMLTAMSDESDKIKGLSLGADDYVVKPFSFAEISMRLKAQIRRNTEYIEPISDHHLIVNGPLTLDLVKLEARKNDQMLSLYTKEFQLFRLFMENLDQIFTQKVIYETIWQDTYRGDSNTIMVHIFNLREKIEDNPKKPTMIKTIRSVGYRMEKF